MCGEILSAQPLRKAYEKLLCTDERMDSSGTAATEPKSIRVRRMVTEVEEALKTETPAQVSARFAQYQQDFPKIFEMLLTRNYSRDTLDMMLRNLAKMESGNISQHDASVAVGTVLVDRFVKPQLKGVPPSAKSSKK
jgi:hypothetical protein